MDGPECPAGFEYVFAWFIDLASARTHGFGPNPITHVEIEAWARLHRVCLLPLEVQLLRRLDLCHLRLIAEQQRGRTVSDH